MEAVAEGSGEGRTNQPEVGEVAELSAVTVRSTHEVRVGRLSLAERLLL